MEEYINKIAPEYDTNFQKAKDGVLSPQQWNDYCADILQKLIGLYDAEGGMVRDVKVLDKMISTIHKPLTGS